MSQEDVNQRNWILGLVYQCPLRSALADCPLHRIRALRPSEAERHIAQLTKAEMESIAARHKACVLERDSLRAQRSARWAGPRR